MVSTVEGYGPRLRVVRPGDEQDERQEDGGEREEVLAGVRPRTLVGEVVDARPEPPRGPAAPVEPERRAAELQPVIPGWLKGREQRAALAAHWWARSRHAVAFHTVRVPKYVGRACLRAPVGAFRATSGALSFLSDGEGRPLRQEAVIGRDHSAYLKLVKERNARIRRRAQAYGTLAFLLVAGGLVAWLLLPRWAFAVGACVLVWVLARYGSPPGRPLVESSVTSFDVPRLTHPMIEAALRSLGIGQLNAAVKAGSGPSFPSDVARDGAGYRAEVDLPLGVTVGDILDRRDRLASALRRPLGTVWPEGDPDTHEGRLVLWVGDRDLSKAGRIAWPLAKTGTHDVFRPFPLGRDPRGRTVEVPLVEHNWLIGSLPGQGKTATVRVIASAAALDPTVELWLHELKGTGDLDGLEQTAHRYVSGIDEEAVAYTAHSLELLVDEVRARGQKLKSLSPDLVPDKKVTRGIASHRRWGLHPIVMVIDECQNLFADKTHGKAAGEHAEYIIKLGRALGIVLVLATQRPDKDSLPTGVSGNVSQRFCLHVAGQVENDMILGTSAYRNGYRATMFRPGVEAGIGIQKGAGPAPVVLRTAYLDGPTTEAIGRRARALREAKGLLTGHAAGQTDDIARERDLVHVGRDVLAAFQPGETALWNEVLIARLTDIRAGAYDGCQPPQLTAALKARGLDVVRDVHRDRRTQRGIRVKDLRAALDLEED